MNKIVETKRIYLRELSINDTKNLALVLCNASSMAYYPRPLTIEEVEKWILRNIKRYETYGYGLWGVVLKENNTLIGDCGLTIQNIDSQFLPEIGFHINPNFCMNGYATEAGKAVLEYVNNVYKIRQIFSYCSEENIPSQKTMKRLGMEYYKNYFEDGKEKIVFMKNFG